MKYAIIGGTGFYDPDILEKSKERTIDTPFGSVCLQSGQNLGREVCFIPRHHLQHAITPHQINYRANIWALKKLGVKYIIATNAVGSVNRLMKPGSFVIIDQFLDFTKSRPVTFFEGDGNPVVHVDVTEPYCSTMREIIIRKGRELQLHIFDYGCYACFEGPRYETAAEIKMLQIIGADVVGMTSVPEAVLAREAGMCYSAICLVTNMGAGIAEQTLAHSDVANLMAKHLQSLRTLTLQSLVQIDPNSSCSCQENKVALPGIEEY